MEHKLKTRIQRKVLVTSFVVKGILKSFERKELVAEIQVGNKPIQLVVWSGVDFDKHADNSNAKICDEIENKLAQANEQGQL